MLSSAGLPLLNGFYRPSSPFCKARSKPVAYWAAFARDGRDSWAPHICCGFYQRTMLGQGGPTGRTWGLPDVSFREIAVFAPLIAWAFWIGIYPKPYFRHPTQARDGNCGACQARILQRGPGAGGQGPGGEGVVRRLDGLRAPGPFAFAVRDSAAHRFVPRLQSARVFPGPWPPAPRPPVWPLAPDPWPLSEVGHEPVLHSRRPLHHHPGSDAGAIRLAPSCCSTSSFFPILASASGW